MITILATVTVEDFDRFYGVFSTRGSELRKSHGSRGARALRHPDDPHRVTVLFDFDWDSQDRIEEFLADPETQATMQAGGIQGPPEITVLEPAGEVDA